jgi:DNA ligase D-like protein (predicted 3'-phosphoesterase)
LTSQAGGIPADMSRNAIPRSGESAAPIFVIQRHDSFRLRFEFRLEVDGVLVSWAVPKGPSADPRDRRLATRSEDRPLDHCAGGRVWDTGHYENLTERTSTAEALDAGHLEFRLAGRKLTGAFTLTRTGIRGNENWLLLKLSDAPRLSSDAPRLAPASSGHEPRDT